MEFNIQAVISEITITPEAALAVVICACLMYIAFLVFVRIFGQRSLAGISTFDALVTIMVGAIAGRVILGFHPTLMAGILGLLTLFILEGIFGALRTFQRGNRLLNVAPRVVMAGNTPLPETLRAARITIEELNTVLRQAGITNYDQVAAVILEPGGKLSVLPAATTIDPQLLRGVRGAELILPNNTVD